MEEMNTVVVFGDSLSDIGTKWRTNVGAFAINQGLMHVSPTGRFSDCRNWTDHMLEAAGGPALVHPDVITATKMSQQFTTLKTSQPLLTPGMKKFTYVNYAMGGACGKAPSGLQNRIGLSTFAEQVDVFLKEVKPGMTGKTLFFIWFGANDLYTAGCEPRLMGDVAKEIASVQRERLLGVMRNPSDARFIFMDLANPLSSVRYNQYLKDAERTAAGQTKPGPENLVKKAILTSNHPNAQMVQAHYQAHKDFKRDFLAYKQTHNISSSYVPRKGWVLWAELAQRDNIPLPDEVLQSYKQQLKLIKDLEVGVLTFNTILNLIAETNNDTVVSLATLLAPNVLAHLVESSGVFLKGAMKASATHVGSGAYDAQGSVRHLTTIDGAHPTDPLYKIMWHEIYRMMTHAQITFGNLPSNHYA
jgi:hypothetical protein